MDPNDFPAAFPAAVPPPGPETALVLAMAASYLGTATTAMVLPVIAVTMVHGGPVSVGILSASTGLPGVVLRVPLGALADRTTHRLSVLAAADAGRLLLTSAVPLLWWTDDLGLADLIGLGLGIGALSVLHAAFMPTVVPALFARERWARVNGRLASAEAGGDALGPALGAGLLRLVAAPLVLLVDTASYGIALAAKVGIARRHGWSPAASPPVAGAPRPHAPPAALPGAGLRPGRKAGPARLAGVLMPIGLGNGAVVALLLLILRVAGHGAIAYGVVLAAGGTGAFAGGALAGPALERLGPARTTVAAAVALALGTSLVPCVLLPGHLVMLPAAGELVGGAGAVVLVVGLISQTQLGGVRIGVTVAQVMFLVEVGQVLGALLGGVAAHAVGLRWVAWAAAIAAVIGAVVAVCDRTRALGVEASA